jgi:hypothetical protein
VAFSGGSTLDKLDVSFEQHCEGAAPAFIGRFRYSRTDPLAALLAPVPAIRRMNLVLVAALMLAVAISV